MSTEELESLFNKHHDEAMKFDRVENPKSFRPDLHAFLLLDKLCPSVMDMVCAAEHDEIFLAPEPSVLAKIITEAEVIDLIRCGVRYSNDGLCMFA